MGHKNITKTMNIYIYIYINGYIKKIDHPKLETGFCSCIVYPTYSEAKVLGTTDSEKAAYIFQNQPNTMLNTHKNMEWPICYL